jgi:hypothetical protein
VLVAYACSILMRQCCYVWAHILYALTCALTLCITILVHDPDRLCRLLGRALSTQGSTGGATVVHMTCCESVKASAVNVLSLSLATHLQLVLRWHQLRVMLSTLLHVKHLVHQLQQSQQALCLMLLVIGSKALCRCVFSVHHTCIINNCTCCLLVLLSL